jgi:hypothetical protein
MLAIIAEMLGHILIQTGMETNQGAKADRGRYKNRKIPKVRC